MRLLADENVRADIVAALRNEGHDVRWVMEDHAGMNDVEVLARAQREDRILITFDKGDFGALIFQQRHPSAGVVLFRVTASSPSDLTSTVVDTLRARTDWSGRFWTVGDETVRARPLP